MDIEELRKQIDHQLHLARKYREPISDWVDKCRDLLSEYDQAIEARDEARNALTIITTHPDGSTMFCSGIANAGMGGTTSPCLSCQMKRHIAKNALNPEGSEEEEPAVEGASP